MATTKKPTLKDVALRSGMSTGTVSLVLNGSSLVAYATRERVMKAIKEIGYVYDRGAAQLRSRRTNILALSVCNLKNPYFAEIAAAIEDSLEKLGYALLMGNCNESVAKQKKFLELVREHNVDGVLIIPARDTKPKDIACYQEWNLPLVMVSRYVTGAKCDFSGTNNRAGAAAGTRHVIELGHRRIAFVGSNRRTSSGRDRAAGFRSAMREAGLSVAPDMIVDCADTREEGFRAVHALYDRPNPPTAVICFNDILAFGVMLGLRALELTPGRDCSVVGYDDVAEATLWRPPLTTVAVDMKRMGAEAADLIRLRIEGSTAGTCRRVGDYRLVIRETSNPPAPAKGARPRKIRRPAHGATL